MDLYLPGMSLFPASPKTVMRVAVEAGFEGVEVFHFRKWWQYPDLEDYRREARALGLGLHFHEAYDWNGDDTHPEVRLPALWGGLLPADESLEAQFGDARERVVAYAHHWPELMAIGTLHPNWTLQTASLVPNGRYKTPYDEFIDAVWKHQLPITLDTQHWFEYQAGWQGVEHVGRLYTGSLTDKLIRFFERYRVFIREIHLNNFEPKGGHAFGRNLWPKEGVLDLREFCRYLRKSGWNGSIVPELHPRFFSRISTQKNIEVATRLCGQVRELWEG